MVSEAQATFNMLRMFQASNKEEQDRVIEAFRIEAFKPCPTCGK